MTTGARDVNWTTELQAHLEAARVLLSARIQAGRWSSMKEAGFAVKAFQHVEKAVESSIGVSQLPLPETPPQGVSSHVITNDPADPEKLYPQQDQGEAEKRAGVQTEPPAPPTEIAIWADVVNAVQTAKREGVALIVSAAGRQAADDPGSAEVIIEAPGLPLLRTTMKELEEAEQQVGGLTREPPPTPEGGDGKEHPAPHQKRGDWRRTVYAGSKGT